MDIIPAAPFIAKSLGFACLIPLPLTGPMLSLRGALAIVLSAYLSFHGAAGEPTIANVFLSFFIGILIAVPAIILVELGGQLGELIDGLRGQQHSALIDPLFEGNPSVLGQAARTFAAILLFVSPIFDLLITILVCSDTSSLTPIADNFKIYFSELFGEWAQLVVFFAVLALIIEILIFCLQTYLPWGNWSAELSFVRLLAPVIFILLLILGGKELPASLSGASYENLLKLVGEL